MPVLPAVPSTITPPGPNMPRFSASSTIASAARSLTELPGLRNSALPIILQPVSSEALRSFIRGVLPMLSTNPSRMFMASVPVVRLRKATDAERSSPAAAKIVAIESEPLQGDDGDGVDDAAGSQAPVGGFEGFGEHPDVLVLACVAV